MTRLLRETLGFGISSPSLKALIRFSRSPTHNTMDSQPATQAPTTAPDPKWKRNAAYVKPDEQLGEGDTTLIKDFLPQSIGVDAFEKLKEEVQWQTMHHHGEHALVPRFPVSSSNAGGEVPRRVAVQGEILEDGWLVQPPIGDSFADRSFYRFPVYRHPADASPPLCAWTPTVEAIRDHVEKTLGHPVNHALIQLYRNSEDYISEHSDKTIDVVRGSNIVCHLPSPLLFLIKFPGEC